MPQPALRHDRNKFESTILINVRSAEWELVAREGRKKKRISSQSSTLAAFALGHARREGFTSMANTNQIGCIRRVKSFCINVRRGKLYSGIPRTLSSLRPFAGTTLCYSAMHDQQNIYFNYSRADDDICYAGCARELRRTLYEEDGESSSKFANEVNGIPSRP